MKIIAVIPARLASTRLPRKMLREIAGKPLVGWVYEAVRSSPLLSEVIVATDSEEIMDACGRYGWNARMTSPNHSSGTERVHEVSDSIDADVYINVQGDEPMVRPEQIATLIDVMKDPAVSVGTLKTPCLAEEIHNPNAVKVVDDSRGRVAWSLVGVGTAVWLVYAELVKIRNICLWCTSVHIISFLIFLSTAFGTLATMPDMFEGEEEEDVNEEYAG
jgi:3-deoxy-D-manno-octulosonate cytidylyltransferase